MKPKFIIRGKTYNSGDRSIVEKEKTISDLNFHIHKFNSRTRLDASRTLVFPCFSEFGCEIVGTMFCIPRLCQRFPGYYKIAVGWYGRAHLYRHLVDEFWEIGEEHQWLREYCRAFHHESRNLKRLEKVLKSYGQLITSEYFAKITLATQCEDCNRYWKDIEGKEVVCSSCGSYNLRKSLFGSIPESRTHAILPITPSKDKMEIAKSWLGENPVGVFARGRKCYGRNLPPDFYVGLIELLEKRGYDPIWLGEKSTTLECPVDRIKDFSRDPISRDLELTMAIVSQCRFTIQFWTASTRIAAMTGTPYLLFESPDQIVGVGQEGRRLRLVTKGRGKISLNDYLNVRDDLEGGIRVTSDCLDEFEMGNDSIHIGLIDGRDSVLEQVKRATWLTT